MTESPHYSQDTIVAAATPPGKGGIGIVRVSGPSVDTDRIATAIIGRIPAARRATNVHFRNSHGELLDVGLALYFPAPGSFTGETVLEMHGHGGPVVLSALVDAAIHAGARRAQPGEFSKRAFLNGKLDLAQAEAIADLIDSGTAQAAKASLRTLRGTFSEAVGELQEQLTRLRLHVEAAIDFPEEEIDFLQDAALEARIADFESAFAKLREQTRMGRVLRDGFQLVILGRPNAGKSSLLNLLSGQDTAIVTEIAGTTRDVLREQLDIDGLLVELVDTAGLRDDPDIIEEEGIRRARDAQKNADGILWVRDIRDQEDADNRHMPADTPMIVLQNKIDLSGDSPGPVAENPLTLNISAETGAGIDSLRDAIRKLAGFRDQGEGAFTARQRHLDALALAATHFATGQAALRKDHAGEIFAEELRLAQQALGEITGTLTSDDLLGRIFAEFCIGK